MLCDPHVGDLVCYNFNDCDQPIKLMAIVLECYYNEGDQPYYKIQFTDDGSQITVSAMELSLVDTLLSYPDTPQ